MEEKCIEDLSTISRNALFMRFSRSKAKGIPIPDDLNAEMGKRFPFYDTNARDFTKKIKRTYFRFIMNGEPVPDDINNSMAKFFADYDPVKRELATPYDMSASTLYFWFKQRKEMELPILDIMNDAMIRLFPGTYNPKTRDFFTRDEFTSLRAARKREKKQAEQQAKQKEQEGKRALTQKLKQERIAEKAEQRLQKRRTVKTFVINREEPLPRINGIFNVSVNQSTIHNNVYDNVFINGKIIIKNVHDVELKTFMDDLVLGVHYTDVKDVRQWRLYNADAKQFMHNSERDQWTIRHASYVDDTLYVYTDLHALISRSRQQIMKRVLNSGHFVIEKSKDTGR